MPAAQSAATTALAPVPSRASASAPPEHDVDLRAPAVGERATARTSQGSLRVADERLGVPSASPPGREQQPVDDHPNSLLVGLREVGRPRCAEAADRHLAVAGADQVPPALLEVDRADQLLQVLGRRLHAGQVGVAARTSGTRRL